MGIVSILFLNNLSVILTVGLVRQHCIHVGPIKWSSTTVNLHPLLVNERCYCIVSILTHWVVSIMAVDIVRQHCVNVGPITWNKMMTHILIMDTVSVLFQYRWTMHAAYQHWRDAVTILLWLDLAALMAWQEVYRQTTSKTTSIQYGWFAGVLQFNIFGSSKGRKFGFSF